MDSLKSFNLNSDHKLRYFYPEVDLSSLLGRVQKFLDLNDDLFLVDLNVKSSYSEEDKDLIWEATLTYFGEAE